MLSVQIPDTKIQIGCKGQPDQIGYLQFCGRRICFPEDKDHPQYQCPQKQQPEKCEAVGLGIEEDGTPEEIYRQLCDKKIQSQTPGLGGRCKINSCCSDTHQRKQHCPDNRKHPARW